MEIVARIIGSGVDWTLPHVAKRWKHHRDVKKNMGALSEASEKLNRRKADLQTRLEIEVIPGETEEAEEVKFWLERVEKIICDVEEIGNKLARVKFLSRARLGRRVEEGIREVERLYEECVEFREGNLVKKLAQRGNEKPTTSAVFGGETTRENTKGEILSCLMNEKITRIGVHGMGGIGKTTVLEHLHNVLLKPGDKIGSKFDKVIWITATKASEVRGLQDKLGRKFELGPDKLNDKDDEEIRASVLLREFNMPKNKRFVLIIDDLWEVYSLDKIGVPSPTIENGCKLVLTTRLRDVCSKMECDEIIEMGLLSEQEAVELFLNKVGKSVASDPKVGEMARRVAAECAGLPLAIVTVAGSMRDKKDPREWDVAVTELQNATSSMSKEITTILRFSYDRLKDEKLRECLLHCALYHEDHMIPRDFLIDQLIALGMVEEARTRKQKTDKCHVMLNELVRDCLLIDAVNHSHEKCVKLHDSVRDMAIQIIRESPSRFLVETAGGAKWNEQLEKVSLIEKNEIILVNEPPNCTRLSTLFLNTNGVETLSEDFFMRMKGLRVLDLSHPRITNLPGSIYSLKNLAVLVLRNCVNLTCVPNLSELKNLIRLDLHNACITEFPLGLENLAKLMHLDLGGIVFKSYPKGLLRGLSELHYLSIVLSPFAEQESAEELTALKKLETLKVAFMSFTLFKSYFRMIRGRVATIQQCDFRFRVGLHRQIDEAPNSVSLYCSRTMDDDCLHEFPIVIPENVENLSVISCYFAKSLCHLAYVRNITNLQRLFITGCCMEYMLYYSPAGFPMLQNIKELELEWLPNLRALVAPEREDVDSPSRLPLRAFSALKKLTLTNCEKLTTLFVLHSKAFLPDLEEILIKDCEQLREIISYENKDTTIMKLPSLKSIILLNLPRLKSAMFVADSLVDVVISNCPELKEITSSLRPFVDY